MKANFGPLTDKVIRAAGWATSNPNCPSSQKWADEFERVFNYADTKGLFAKYLNRLTSSSYSQFDSALAELRVACYLEGMGLPVCGWEPIPRSGNAGEFIVKACSGKGVFAEVKSPGWESELDRAELRAGRAKQEKYQDMQGTPVAPHAAIEFAIRKAYKKFDSGCSNLLVIADDLFVQLETAPDTFAQRALYGPGGSFTTPIYENLGGVGIFWVQGNCDPVTYKMRLFLNENALPTTAIPEEMVNRLR